MDPLDRSLIARSQDPAAQLQVAAMGDLGDGRAVDETDPNGYPPPADSYTDKRRIFDIFAFGDGAGIAAAASWTLRFDAYTPDFVYVAMRNDATTAVELYLNGNGTGIPIYLRPGGAIMLPWHAHTQLYVKSTGAATAFGNAYPLDAKTASMFFHFASNS